MVKQQKVLRDGGGPSKVPVAIISVSGRSRMTGVRINQRRSRLVQVLRMLSQKHLQVESEGESGASSSKSVEGEDGGDGNSGAVTPESYASGEGSKKFPSSGRTGRRNAMPNIFGQHVDTGTSDLSTRLEALTTDPKHDQPGTSGMDQNDPSTSVQCTGR